MSEGEKAVQDPLVDELVNEIKDIKEEIGKLETHIGNFDLDQSSKTKFDKERYLKWQDLLIVNKKRLTGLEADLRSLKAQLTPQHGKGFHSFISSVASTDTSFLQVAIFSFMPS